MPWPATGRRPDGARARGAVTVELAAVVPLLVALTVALAGVVLLARDQVLVQGAAREGARAGAVSGDRSRAIAAATAALPGNRAARVQVDRHGPDRIRVRVHLPVRIPPSQRVTLTATAVAAFEPGLGPGRVLAPGEPPEPGEVTGP